MAFKNARSRRKYFAMQKKKCNSSGILKKIKPDETSIGIKLSTYPIPHAEFHADATWEKKSRA